MVNTNDLALPLAGIVALALIGYFILVLIVILVRHMLYMQGVLKQTETKEASDTPCCASFCTFMIDMCGCKACSVRKMLISCCPQKQLDLEPLVTCPCFRTSGEKQQCQFINCVCCELGVAGQNPTQ